MTFPEMCFRKLRGASIESGGSRELSWGMISNSIRQIALELSAGSNGRVLEVGCGEGLLLKKIYESSSNAVFFAVDIHGWMIQKSKVLFKEKGKVKFIKCSALNLPVKPGSFDMVVCINTLHNQCSFEDVRAILDEMTRVCSDKGKIIFDVRNSRNPFMYMAYRMVMLYDRTCARLPLRTYSLKEIANLLSDLKFVISQRKAVLSPNFDLAPAFVLQACGKK